MNVLIGDISSYKAIAVAKFIHENYPSVVIYSFDSRKFTRTFRTKYVYKNFIIEDDNIESFIEIIIKYKINHFIPVINESLEIFWKNKDRLNHTLDYLGSFLSYQILNDKSQLHDLAINLEVLVPVKYPNIASAEFPFIIKPTNLSSAKGVFYINERNDIPNNFTQKNTIIQQFVDGIGVGYSFYCNKGTIVNGYGHKRLAEYPVTGGSSTYRTHYNDQRMYDVSSRIVKSLDYTGFAMFEFKLTHNNELYLLEVNPRIWGSINQGLVNGTNYFENILGPPKKQIKKDKVHFNTYLGPLVYMSFLKYLLKLNFDPLLVFFKNFNSSLPDVSILQDLKGYMSILFRKLLS